MLKKIICPVIVALFSLTPLTAATNEYSLGEAIQFIKAAPESAALYNHVERQGAVQFLYHEMEDCPFNALWDSEERLIIVNASKVKTIGKLVSSILFELHNAKSDHTLKQLAQQAENGAIDKETYVHSIEEIEYKNIVNAARIIRIAIGHGLFPSDSWIHTFYTFDNHYKLQQIFGHSQWLADQYDLLNPSGKGQPYYGTLPNLNHMNSTDKQTLLHFLAMKDGLHSSYPKEAAAQTSALIAEYLLLAHLPDNHKEQQLFLSAFHSLK